MVKNKIQNSNILFLTLRTLAHIVLFFFALAGLTVLLVAVYHTLVYVSTRLWTPTFITVLPALTFILALGVVFLRQPVQNLLCLISVFFSVVALYLYAGAEYLAFLFLIVYVGAIAILFLFVIMLLHIKKQSAVSSPGIAGLLTPFGVVVAGTCIGVDDLLASTLEKLIVENTAISYQTEPNTISSLSWYVSNQFSDILLFSDILYRANSFLFFLVSLLLLTAMLGAIVLATSATDEAEPTSHTKQKRRA